MWQVTHCLGTKKRGILAEPGRHGSGHSPGQTALNEIVLNTKLDNSEQDVLVFFGPPSIIHQKRSNVQKPVGAENTNPVSSQA